MNYHNDIIDRITEAESLKKRMLDSSNLIDAINASVNIILNSYKNSGGRIYFAGNGGSAADAQHLAAELVGRFYLNRASLNAEALTVNSSSVTAIANDFGYDKLFARAIEGKGRAGDVFVGISTSGNSENIVQAIKKCKEMDIKTIGFTGEKVGKMDELCDIMVKIPSVDTPRVQEGHILAGHILCELVEREMFPNV